MTDFSINESSLSKGKNPVNLKETEYEKLKNKYKELAKNMANTDFANSPTLKQSLMEQLADLKGIATAQGNEEELKWIGNEEAALLPDREKDAQNPHDIPYYLPLNNNIKAALSKPNQPNEDVDKLLTSAGRQMLKADISSVAVIKLIKALTSVDKTTGIESVNPEGVKAVINLKRSLVASRSAEEVEKNSAVYKNKKPVEIARDKGFVLLQNPNGTLDTLYIDENTTLDDAKEQYNELITQKEDELLLEFVKKFKASDCSIDPKYNRVINYLRNAGITYKSILPLTSLSIDKNGNIDNNTLNLIKEIKSSGALSSDIISIQKQIERDENGVYNPEDVEKVCALSASAVAQPQLSELFLTMKSNEKASQFIHTAAKYFNNKQNFVDLVNLTKSDGKNVDEIALEIVDDLLLSKNNDKSEKDFITFISDVLNLVKGSDSKIKPEAEKLCCLIDKFSQQEVYDLLQLCTSEDGFDADLANIAYNLYQNGADYYTLIEGIVSNS